MEGPSRLAEAKAEERSNPEICKMMEMMYPKITTQGAKIGEQGKEAGH